MKRGTTKLRFLLLIAVILGIFYAVSESETVKNSLVNPESLRSFVLGFGILAPLGIILLQAFQTTISIVPSQLTTVLAGFIFGPLWGLVYSVIGAFIGSMIIFTLARNYGAKIASIFFEHHDITHFTLFFKQKKLLALFLARVAPIFPNDLVSFTAGLTNIDLLRFNLVSTAGFVVQMILLTYFGAELSAGNVSMPLIVITLAVTGLLILFLFKEDIHALIIRDLHRIEKEGKSIKKPLQKGMRIILP